jgi:glutaredoxin 3
MESPIKSLPSDLSTLLSPGKVFIFTKTNCPFCDLTKEYLAEMNIPYEYVVCDTLGITDEHKEQLFKLTGAKTYPRIFVGTKSVGGFDDLRKSDDNGSLHKLLAAENIKANPDWWLKTIEVNKTSSPNVQSTQNSQHNHEEKEFGHELPIKKLPDDLSTLLTPGKLFIFTKTNCPFCDLTKEYLAEKEISYDYVVCDTLGITDEHKEQLFKLTGAKSYPRIFVGTKSVGGFDDLRSKDDKGIFEKMLQEEGIGFKRDWYTSKL